jgi:hypothetical protein
MYQRVVLVGNLGRDPEMRYTPNGTPVTSFSVATSRKYTGSDGQMKDETLWFRISVWGKYWSKASWSETRMAVPAFGQGRMASRALPLKCAPRLSASSVDAKVASPVAWAPQPRQDQQFLRLNRKQKKSCRFS